MFLTASVVITSYFLLLLSDTKGVKIVLIKSVMECPQYYYYDEHFNSVFSFVAVVICLPQFYVFFI